jgi:hypothetical protein
VGDDDAGDHDGDEVDGGHCADAGACSCGCGVGLAPCMLYASGCAPP